MTEAHDLFFSAEPILGPAARPLDRTVLDLTEHHEDPLVGAAVKRARKRPDRRGDRSVGICKRRAGHASRKRGRVHAVLGVEGERDVEDSLGRLRGHVPLKHVEEVRSVRELSLRRNELLAPTDAMPGGDDRRHLGDEADGRAEAIVAIGDVISRIEHPERRHRRHERVQRMTVGRKRPEKLKEGGIDRAFVLEGVFEPLELVARRQGAVEQEVAHLFKSAVLGESLDRIASVLKLSNLTVQITYARPRSGDARQPRDIFRGVRHSFPRKSWVAPGALAIAMPSQTSEWRAPRAESSHADEGHGPLTWDLLA